MRMSNITMLIAALICAGAAALLSRAWLKSQTGAERILATTQEAPVASPVRSIVVAARDLKYGEKLTPDMLRLMPWRGETLPKGAFLSIEPLSQAGQERTVLSAIAESEPVLEGRLSGGASQGMMAAKLAESMNAITIRVNDVAGVAGFVQPDDKVDVFLTIDGKATDDPATSKKPSVVVLLQSVRVLATDQQTQRKAQASPPKAVTLEVNTEDAQKLVLAGSIGQLSLALRRTDGRAQAGTRSIALEDLISNGANAKAAAPAKNGQVIGVTRAAERKEYTVQPDQQKNRRYEVAR
jgi:pilus assembly protein CpaB